MSASRWSAAFLANLEKVLDFRCLRANAINLSQLPKRGGFIPRCYADRTCSANWKSRKRHCRSTAGGIRIAAQPIYVDTYLIDVVAKFKRARPNVSVSIVDTGLEGLLEQVATRQCDLGILVLRSICMIAMWR